MKKLIAVLTVLCLLAACTAALAETPAETVVTFRNGVTFGMNQNEVRTAENWVAVNMTWKTPRRWFSKSSSRSMSRKTACLPI